MLEFISYPSFVITVLCSSIDYRHPDHRERYQCRRVLEAAPARVSPFPVRSLHMWALRQNENEESITRSVGEMRI